MEYMISQLPDAILISIISLLPTKEALCTIILSKRWRNLFRFVSALAFLCKHPKCGLTLTCNSEQFISAVHGILQRHSTYIRSFEYRSCLLESCTQTFEKCIFSLGGLGIQELKIRVPDIASSTRLHFSSHLLSLMPSLEYFELSDAVLQQSLENPCNSLRTICLFEVTIPFPDSLESILSNCLSLCTLTIKRCDIYSTSLRFPRIDLNLKSIVIQQCFGLEEICFYAPNLTKFELVCLNPVNIIFDYVPHLQSVHLVSQKKDVPYFCGQLDKNVPSLNTLHLDAIGDLYQDGSIAMGTNMFSKLKRLELAVCNHEFNLCSLIRVVHGCPLLEEFELATWVKSFVWPEEEMPVKVHSQLKVVDISGFGGSDSEFSFISYILRSTVKLQQMIISWYVYMYEPGGFGKREDSYDPLPPNFYKQDKSYFCPPLPKDWKWEQVCECIQQMKGEAAAVSDTLQVVTRECLVTPPPLPRRQVRVKHSSTRRVNFRRAI